MLFNRQIDLVFHLLVVSFSRDFINKKNEKGHLLKITRRSYTADHTASTACLWNQNGCFQMSCKAFFNGKSP